MINLIDSIQELAPVLWLTDPDNKRRENINFNGVRIQNLFSSKGLQYKAVILIWADQLPRDWGDIDESKDQRLLYVGLTRPEQYLVVTSNGSSKFVDKISNSESVILA